MSGDHSHDSTATKGPQLLEERSLSGIFVHLLAIPTGVFGAGLVYLLSTNEFTKQNARNAVDWHLTVLALTISTFGSVFAYSELTGQEGATIATVPSLVASGGSIVVSALLSLWTIVPVLTIIVGLFAMGNAIFGTAWRYPLAPRFVERIEPIVARSGGWLLLILAYTAVAPLIIGTVLFGPREGVTFLLSGVGMIGLILVLTPATGAALYQHGERNRPNDADWQPPVVAYIGTPILVAVAGYVGSDTFTDSIYPAGDAMYVFLGAFWVATVVYVLRWWTVSR